ncbi:MAG: aminopeptidase family protein P, partial [Pseudomonadota bacterium]|nr:aminopeptidase family protein P [Pseudomonadota bacterium]
NIIHDKNNIIDQIWLDRPVEIKKKFFSLDKIVAGQDIYDKQRELFKINNSDIIIINSPESVCWLLNIRGFDLPHTPIVFSRIIISKSGMKLFVDREKIPDKKFKIVGLKIFKLDDFEKQISKLPKNKKIFLDSMSSFYFYDFLLKQEITPIIGIDPCKFLKSQKNHSEIKWAKKSHLYDGVSLVKFFCWLENLDYNQKITELDASKKLENYKNEVKSFFSLSFPTISAVGPSGAIIHYNPKIKSRKLEKNKMYLCDSGSQYYGGTTDITRTIFLGKSKPKKEFISNYTKILLGHIDISMMKFPEGTKGYQIDSIARYYLWQDGMDYNHGTGHGVGSFLGVHEGPQSVSKKFNNFNLKEGMIISNEPGFYKKKEYGIRIENLVLVRSSKKKGFLEFETLTLFPYERSLIDKDLLSKNQKDWINSYHERVSASLSDYLSKDLRNWLKKKTKKI